RAASAPGIDRRAACRATASGGGRAMRRGLGRWSVYGGLGAASAGALLLAGCNLGVDPAVYDAPGGHVRSADVNGDGHVDLVTTGGTGDTRSAVLLGDGTGQFTATVSDDGHGAQSLA